MFNFMGKNLSYTSIHLKCATIIRNIDFGFHAPQIVCLLGTNGAGKSTLLKMCAGILKPDCGSVFLDEQDIFQMPQNRLAQKVGWLPQNLSACENFTVFDFLSLNNRLHGELHSTSRDRISCAGDCLRLFDLDGFLHKEISQLSGGEWKRLQLARLWASNSKILLLDEPDSDLDPYHKQQLIKQCQLYVKKNHAIILISTHDVFFAQKIATQICVLCDGFLVWDSNASRFWETGAIDHVYGTHILKDTHANLSA